MKATRALLLMTLFVVNLTENESHYTDQDWEVVENLGISMDVKSFAVVNSRKGLNIVKTIKKFSRDNLLCSVIDSRHLEKELNHLNETKFFDRRTMIITKEELNFTNLLAKISFSHLVAWVVFAESFDAKNSYIPLNTEVFVIHSTSDDILVNQVYHLKPGRNITVKNIGTWQRGKIKSTSITYESSITNFENITMDVLHFLGQETCIPGVKHVLNGVECFHLHIIRIAAEILNFSINSMECPEKVYPFQYPNGSLSALFLILIRREADISSASYVITNERLDWMDFAWPTFTTKSMMYVRKSRSRLHWRAYLKPFDKSFWQAIALWILLIGLMTQIFKGFHAKNLKFRLRLISEIIKSIMDSLQMFCNQALPNMSSWCSIRIIFLMTIFTSLILYQAYSAHLISSLTIVTPYFPFKDVNGLFREKEYKIMTLKTGFHKYFVKTIINAYGVDAHEILLDEYNLPKNTESGIDKLCKKNRAVYLEFRENIVQYNLECQITEIPTPLMLQSVGLGFPKNSPYRHFISREFTVLHSSGILQRMRRHLFSYVKLQQKEVSSDEYVTVSYRHVASNYLLLGFGIIISVVILALEILWDFYTNRIDKSRKFILPKRNKRTARLQWAYKKVK